MVWHGIVWYGLVTGMVSYGMSSYGMVWYGIEWYNMVFKVKVWMLLKRWALSIHKDFEIPVQFDIEYLNLQKKTLVFA